MIWKWKEKKKKLKKDWDILENESDSSAHNYWSTWNRPDDFIIEIS